MLSNKMSFSMRHVILAAALALVGLTPRVGTAQPTKRAKAVTVKPSAPATESNDEGEGDSGDTDDAQGGALEGSAEVLPGDGAKASGSGTSHTVERGDTLWDLSQKYMGSPWYWPKVWSYNPEIANPHWIYPGNLVRFFTTGEEVPTQVEAGEPLGDPLEEGTPMADDADKVQVAGKIGYQPKSGVHLRTKGFVTAKEVEEAGRIVGSFEESEMLSFPQQAYVQFKNKGGARLGDKYLIFRTEKEVIHPKTEDPVGFLTMILGTAKAVAANNEFVTVQITASYDEIRRGDMIGPFGESLFKTVGDRPADRDIKGTIVSSIYPWESTVGQNSLVVLDVGSDQGVQPGNVFHILRQQEGLTYENLNYPPAFDGRWPVENVGSCIAFDVKSSASTCVLTRSLREIAAGDFVESKAGGSSSAPRASR